ncbi:MAG: HAD-IIA family hydrolase [Solirubrobacterales bacterium]
MAPNEYDGYLFDLDGVIWLGGEPIPGAPGAVAELIAAGAEVAFLSNNSRHSPAEYAERLRAIGVEVAADRVLTSGAVTARLAASAAGEAGRALVIGTGSFRREVEAAGLEAVGEGPAEVVVVSGHEGFDYGELRAACAALGGGARLFATTRDPTMPMPDGPWPGTGAILAAIEAASGARAEIGGKPERHLFEAARSALGGARRVVMVGDRIDSDLGGAGAVGLDGILVLSGATSRQEAEAAGLRPGQILDSVADLVAMGNGGSGGGEELGETGRRRDQAPGVPEEPR